MSEFTSGKWKADAKTIRTSCRVFRTVRVNDIDRLSVAIIPVIHGMPEEEALANARLIAAAPEMYELLNSFAHLATYDNFVTVILRTKAHELLARIDGKEAHS